MVPPMATPNTLAGSGSRTLSTGYQLKLARTSMSYHLRHGGEQ